MIEASGLSEKARMKPLTDHLPPRGSERGLARATKSSGEVRKGGEAPLRDC